MTEAVCSQADYRLHPRLSPFTPIPLGPVGSSEGDMKTASSRKYEGYEVSTGCISLALSPPSSPFILSSHSSHFPSPRREERREERYAIVTTTEGRSEVSVSDEGSDDRPVPAVGRRQGDEGKDRGHE